MLLKDLTKLQIERYIIFLKENKNFTTTFYEIGDGIAVSTKND